MPSFKEANTRHIPEPTPMPQVQTTTPTAGTYREQSQPNPVVPSSSRREPTNRQRGRRRRGRRFSGRTEDQTPRAEQAMAERSGVSPEDQLSVVAAHTWPLNYDDFLARLSQTNQLVTQYQDQSQLLPQDSFAQERRAKASSPAVLASSITLTVDHNPAQSSADAVRDAIRAVGIDRTSPNEVFSCGPPSGSHQTPSYQEPRSPWYTYRNGRITFIAGRTMMRWSNTEAKLNAISDASVDTPLLDANLHTHGSESSDGTVESLPYDTSPPVTAYKPVFAVDQNEMVGSTVVGDSQIQADDADDEGTTDSRPLTRTLAQPESSVHSLSCHTSRPVTAYKSVLEVVLNDLTGPTVVGDLPTPAEEPKNKDTVVFCPVIRSVASPQSVHSLSCDPSLPVPAYKPAPETDVDERTCSMIVGDLQTPGEEADDDRAPPSRQNTFQPCPLAPEHPRVQCPYKHPLSAWSTSEDLVCPSTFASFRECLAHIAHLHGFDEKILLCFSSSRTLHLPLARGLQSFRCPECGASIPREREATDGGHKCSVIFRRVCPRENGWRVVPKDEGVAKYVGGSWCWTEREWLPLVLSAGRR
ncbi:hypothetical protein CALVIDRAFT_535269 [Calocera viscosa TUFC12733]|uniref:Uncharacterized protein n=1 Tax=Calocera viscosa (strain TUFC12733) TaxID=1330018 RepID=A0A167PD46_CALVF|nr:hypothetical protein CALVIDRAFT_535269 [Calocera viscosa TUFC12733]